MYKIIYILKKQQKTWDRTTVLLLTEYVVLLNQTTQKLGIETRNLCVGIGTVWL